VTSLEVESPSPKTIVTRNHQRRASRQSHRCDEVRHRRHRNRHGARRPRASTVARVCCITVTHRVFQQKEKKIGDVDMDELLFSGLVSGVASRPALS